MKKTILFLAANPIDTDRLRLDKELREIKNGLQRSNKRDEFVLEQVWAARPIDIRRAILDHSPSIVHFSGHGAGIEGIAFEDDDGKAKLVDAETLSDFFKLFSNNINCVVLNACYSEIQAEVISRHINHVIGMKKEIGDITAIEYAVAFYDGLGAGKSIEFSHQLACNAIQWKNIPEHLTPSLNSRNTISLRFQDIEVRAVLQIIADLSGLNFIISDTIQGNMTLNLQSVPWTQALRIVLERNGLIMRQEGNVVDIRPYEEMIAFDQFKNELHIYEKNRKNNNIKEKNYFEFSVIDACSALNELGLLTKNWHKDEMGWFAVSNYLEIGEPQTPSSLANNLAFYVESDVCSHVKSMKIVLNINNPKMESLGIFKLTEATDFLFKKLSLNIPHGLLESLQNVSNTQFLADFGIVNIMIEKSKIDTIKVILVAGP
ncbi:MAG: secretin and TonB N-terminal domain-containing protein [Bacteroidetes bacterium]|nr:secretin and TonB N-terminal domain-containing protein [Bacteroidota bacterium]